MQQTNDRVVLSSAFVTAEVILDGAIIWKPSFKLSDGRWVSPFAEAPWSNDEMVSHVASLPPYIRKLGGSFFCLPFGGKSIPPGTDAEWSLTPSTADALLHGYTSNAVWQVVQLTSDRVSLRLDFPSEHPISHVEQTISCVENTATLRALIVISARRDVRMSAAIHPIVRLPESSADRLTLHASFARGYTYPVLDLKGTAACSASFTDLAEIPGRTGENKSFARLPFEEPSQDILLLCECEGALVADFGLERYSAYVDWDRVALPNCLLWYSDRSISEWPFNERFRGLGLEPCASAFDFSDAASTSDNPLRKKGETTSLQLVASQPTTLWYCIGVTTTQSQCSHD